MSNWLISRTGNRVPTVYNIRTIYVICITPSALFPTKSLTAALAFFRPKLLGFLHANHKSLLLLFIIGSDPFPALPQT